MAFFDKHTQHCVQLLASQVHLTKSDSFATPYHNETIARTSPGITNELNHWLEPFTQKSIFSLLF